MGGEITRKQKNKGGAGKKTPCRGVKSAPREGTRGAPVRNAKYELAERKVFEWFAGQRVEGNRVTSRLIRVEMKLAVAVFYPVDGNKFRAFFFLISFWSISLLLHRLRVESASLQAPAGQDAA